MLPAIRLPWFLHVEYQVDKPFVWMKCNGMAMLSFNLFLGDMIGNGGGLAASILGCIEGGAKVSRTLFLHIRVAFFEFPKLVRFGRLEFPVSCSQLCFWTFSRHFTVLFGFFLRSAILFITLCPACFMKPFRLLGFVLDWIVYAKRLSVRLEGRWRSKISQRIGAGIAPYKQWIKPFLQAVPHKSIKLFHSTMWPWEPRQMEWHHHRQIPHPDLPPHFPRNRWHPAGGNVRRYRYQLLCIFAFVACIGEISLPHPEEDNLYMVASWQYLSTFCRMRAG